MTAQAFAAPPPHVTVRAEILGLHIAISHQGCVDIEKGDMSPINDVLKVVPVIGDAVAALFSLGLSDQGADKGARRWEGRAYRRLLAGPSDAFCARSGRGLFSGRCAVGPRLTAHRA